MLLISLTSGLAAGDGARDAAHRARTMAAARAAAAGAVDPAHPAKSLHRPTADASGGELAAGAARPAARAGLRAVVVHPPPSLRAPARSLAAVTRSVPAPTPSRDPAAAAGGLRGVGRHSLACDGCPPGDPRSRVPDTEAYPYSAVGSLTGRVPGRAEGLACSGVLVSPRHVLTAAHCVFDIKASRAYVASLQFVPARAGGGGAGDPLPAVPWARARVADAFVAEPGYTPRAMSLDVALVTLARDAHPAAGWLGVPAPGDGEGVVITSRAPRAATFNLSTAGFPTDKQPAGSMWRSACPNTSATLDGTEPYFLAIPDCAAGACAHVVRHTCASSAGQSGSPLFTPGGSVRAVLIGQVDTGAGSPPLNVGVKMDDTIHAMLAGWYAEDAARLAGLPLSLQRLPTAGSGQQARVVRKVVSLFGVRVDLAVPGHAAALAVVVVVVCGIVLALVGLCCRKAAAARRAAAADAKEVAAALGVAVAATARR